MPLTKQLPGAARDFFALPFSDYISSLSLSASAAESITVPEKATFVLFSSTADIYVDFNKTAVEPGDLDDGTAPELNPTMRKIEAGQKISVISPSACVVTAAFYINK